MKKITFVIFLFSFFINSLSVMATENVVVPINFGNVSGDISKEMSKNAKENKVTLLAYIEGVDCSDPDASLFGTIGVFTCKITDRSAYKKSVDYFSQFLSTGMRESSNGEVGDYFFNSNITANLSAKDNDILEFQLIKRNNLPTNVYYLRDFEENWKFQIQIKSLIPKILETSKTTVKLNPEMLAMVNAFKKQFPTMSLKQNSLIGLVFQNLPKEFSYDYIGPTINGKILKHEGIFGGDSGSDINGKLYAINYTHQDPGGASDFERTALGFEQITTKKGIFGAFIINYTDREITFVDIKNIPEFKLPETVKKSNTDTTKTKFDNNVTTSKITDNSSSGGIGKVGISLLLMLIVALMLYFRKKNKNT